MRKVGGVIGVDVMSETSDGGGEATATVDLPAPLSRTTDAADRVARLRALHLKEGTAGLLAYCQRRLEQSFAQGR